MADIALRIKADFKAAEKAFSSVAQSSESFRQKINKAAKNSEKLQISLKKSAEKAKINSAALMATRGKTAALAYEKNHLRKTIENLIKNGISPESAQVKKLQRDYINLNSQLGKVDKKTRSTALSFKTLTASIVGANIIESGLRSIGRGFASIITEARRLEDAEASFVPLMGGTEKASELVKQLNIAAAETPFRFDAISKTAKQLLPVMNQDINLTISTLKMLGDTAGGNAQKLESITRGFTKAMLKGKVDMESLNMIAEAGVPIFSEMAKTLGYGEKQMKKFFKDVSAGKIKTDDLVKTFQKMTSEGGLFFEGMIIASKTTSGVISTMKDNIAMTAAGIGQKFLPYIKEVAIWITKVSASILKWITEGDNLSNLLSNIGTVLKIAIGALIAYKGALLAVYLQTKIAAAYQLVAATATGIYMAANYAAATGTNVFSVAIKGLTTAMRANPIGMIITAIGLLVVGIYLLITNWAKVKYHVIDFTTSANIALLELVVTIRDKVGGAIKAMNEQFAKLPFMEKYVNKFNDGWDRIGKGIKYAIYLEKQRKFENEKSYNKTLELIRKEREELEKGKPKVPPIFGNPDDLDKEFNEQMARWEKYKNSVTQITGSISTLMQNLGNRRLKMLDERMQAELRAAGVAEKTQVEQAKAELDAAIETGNAITIEEKQRAYDRAVIEEKYHDKRRKLEYETAMNVWKFQVLEAKANAALAISRAIATGMKGGPPLATAFAVAAALATGVQVAAAYAAKPVAPSAETGLINYTVPEVRGTRNDGAAFFAQGGETVNVTPRGEESGRNMIVNVQIEEDTLIRVVQRYIDTGRVNVNNRNIGRGVFAT